MSSQRLDAISPVEYESQGQKKTRWVKVGVAFARDKGGWDVRLDALPINGRLMLMEPNRDSGGGRRGGNDQAPSGGFGGGDSGGDDALPF